MYEVAEISPNFISVGVSGVDHGNFLVGRPYGGCSILYRKSLSSFITPIHSCSNQFCAVKLCDSNGLIVLITCLEIIIIMHLMPT